MSMRAYDEVISLGYNCEISFRIRDYYGKLCSWPFSWSYILDRDSFLNALDNLDDLFQGDVYECQDSRVNSMLECGKYHICFHPRSEYVLSDGTVSEEMFDQAVIELRERITYLVNKFKIALQDKDKKFVFFIGLTNNGSGNDRDFLISLKHKLDKLCPAQNYTLVGVVPKERFLDNQCSLDIDNIQIRLIRKFGKQKCNDISTDAIGWGKIFCEFLGKEGIVRYFLNLESHRIKRIFTAILKRLSSKLK